MKKIKLYNFEGDGKTVKVSPEALLSGSCVVYSLGKVSPGKIRKPKKDLVKKEKKNEIN